MSYFQALNSRMVRLLGAMVLRRLRSWSMKEDLPLPHEPSMEQVSGARVLGATRKSASALT